MINWILNALTVLEAILQTGWENDAEKLERRKKFVEGGLHDDSKKTWQYKMWMQIYDRRIKQLKAPK